MGKCSSSQSSPRWASVPGYSVQEVSTSGEVRYTSSHMPCRLTTNVNGRKHVRLVPDDGGRFVSMPVARVVLLTFVGPPPSPEKRYGCHRNDECTDDRLENLYWGSPKENCRDAWRNGRQKRRGRRPGTSRRRSLPIPSLASLRSDKDIETDKLVADRICSVMRSNLELAAYLGTRSSIEKWIQTVAEGMRLVLPPDEPVAAPARTPQGAAAC